jgi:hypothetical protein
MQGIESIVWPQCEKWKPPSFSGSAGSSRFLKPSETEATLGIPRFGWRVLQHPPAGSAR